LPADFSDGKPSRPRADFTLITQRNSDFRVRWFHNHPAKNGSKVVIISTGRKIHSPSTTQGTLKKVFVCAVRDVAGTFR